MKRLKCDSHATGLIHCDLMLCAVHEPPGKGTGGHLLSAGETQFEARAAAGEVGCGHRFWGWVTAASSCHILHQHSCCLG